MKELVSKYWNTVDISFTDISSFLKSNFVKYHFSTKENTLKHLKAFGDIIQIKNVVEWGAGYGLLASILLQDENIHYTIIDLPEMIEIQKQYLKNYKNRINYISVTDLLKEKIKADLFIALWSLSESTEKAVLYCKENNFFSAKNIMIATQEKSTLHPAVNMLNNILRDMGIKPIRIKFLPQNLYYFKKENK